MTINITPLDQQFHLKQFEPKFGGSTFDHSGRPLAGWKAERDHAHNNVAASKVQSKPVAKKNKPVVGESWIAKIADMFKLPRFAG